jgi:hypothetical protein
MKEVDVDEDGAYTLLDLYLWTAKSVATEYKTGELLATEHALLDDTGDGRGTELQTEYLTEELGGKLKAGTKPMPRPGDGDAARKIRLATPPEKKPEAEKPADEKPAEEKPADSDKPEKSDSAA